MTAPDPGTRVLVHTRPVSAEPTTPEQLARFVDRALLGRLARHVHPANLAAVVADISRDLRPFLSLPIARETDALRAEVERLRPIERRARHAASKAGAEWLYNAHYILGELS